MEPNFKRRRKIACITSALMLIVLVSYDRCSSRDTEPDAYRKAVVQNVQTGLKNAEKKTPLHKVGL